MLPTLGASPAAKTAGLGVVAPLAPGTLTAPSFGATSSSSSSSSSTSPEAAGVEEKKGGNESKEQQQQKEEDEEEGTANDDYIAGLVELLEDFSRRQREAALAIRGSGGGGSGGDCGSGSDSVSVPLPPDLFASVEALLSAFNSSEMSVGATMGAGWPV